jgi:hypothetical protein
MFSQNDLKNVTTLITILNEVKLEVKGDAISTVASVFSWVKNDLKKIIEDDLKPKVSMPMGMPKPLDTEPQKGKKK